MDDEFFMGQALELAGKAYDLKEVPVGALVVYQNKIISSSFNQVESLQDATAHAEISALRLAQNEIKNWRLKGCVLYTSLEPCVMCYGAAILSRVDRIVFGAQDLRHGACGGCFHLHERPHPIHQPLLKGGVLESQSQTLLKNFFKMVRYENRNPG